MKHAMNDSFKVISNFERLVSGVWGLCAAVLSVPGCSRAEEATASLMHNRSQAYLCVCVYYF